MPLRKFSMRRTDLLSRRTDQLMRRHGRKSSTVRKKGRRTLLEQLESRQLLAADASFVDSLPSAIEANFGDSVISDQGREVCLAFRSESSQLEGEQIVGGALAEAPGPVDLSAAIVQPAGPLAPGAAFTSEITFTNTGPGDATATTLEVTFDANLTGVTWEREIIRAQPAVVPTSDLIGSNGFTAQGVASTDLAGLSVAGGGDFNNDGVDDVIVAAPGTSNGTVYVVFGDAVTGFAGTFDLGSLDGTNGFTIVGAGAGNNLGSDVGNAGDVNDDGIADIIVGASGANGGAGVVYVIYGSGASFPAQIDAGLLNGTNGFAIPGLAAGDGLGWSVSPAGDVNNDNVDDIIVGANNAGAGNEGAAYVVFGSNSFGSSFDLATLAGANGFSIVTATAGQSLGFDVDGAGDVNDDGLDDLIVGAPGSVLPATDGAAYVVFGQNSSASVDVGGLTATTGIAMPAPRSGHTLGHSVSGAGDVNDDGIADVILADDFDGSNAGQGYLLFGSDSGFTSPFDLSTLNGTNGVIIEAPASNHPNLMVFDNGGDINGDGIEDLILGLPEDEDFLPAPAVIPGGGYVVFGNGSGFSSPLNLASLDGSNGFLVDGANVSDVAGFAVGAAGDVNDDGLDDLVIGGPFASPGGNLAAGEAYIYYGRGSSISNGSGNVNETLDVFPGDQVIYRVSANIAPAATGSTTVDATATPDAAVSDTDLLNNSASATTTIGAPPSVANVQINDGVNPTRSQITSLTVTFDSIVEHGPLDNAFQITQIDTSTPVGIVNVAKSDSSGVTVATLTFDGTSTYPREGTGELGNSLIDGNFQLVVLAANVLSGGVPMAADDASFGDERSDDFFRLYGDANGDGVVDTADLFDHFAPSFTGGAFRPDLDGQGDGNIDTMDLFDYFAIAFTTGASRP